MKKLLFSTVALIAAMSVDGSWQGARAADLPVKAPPLVRLDPWSGWYAGLSVGAAVQRTCDRLSPQGDTAFGNFVVDGIFLASLGNGCATSTGFIGGGQVGVNQRFGNWVWGLEADASGLTTKTSRTSSGTSPTFGNPFTAVHATTADALVTVRPRLGMLFNENTLLYVTAGLAIGHLNASGSETGPVGPPQFLGSGSVSDWTYGLAVGGGVEAKIGGPWSVKAEYLYVNLHSINYDTTQPAVNALNGFANIGDNIAVPTQLHIFRVGVNYKWGGSENWVRANAALAPPVFNWTGLYAGAHMGGSWGTSKSTDLSNFNATGDVITAKTKGIIGGVQAGYNWQMNSIVLGVESDFGYLEFRGRGNTALFDGFTFLNSSGGLYGTLRGRLGFAWDRMLFYGTGGLMVASVGANVNNPFNPTLPNDPNNLVGDAIIFTNKTRAQVGWTLGGGMEYGLDNGWSVKGEYLHFDLGTKQVAGSIVNPGDPAFIGVPWAFDIRNTGDFVRLGVNRKIF